MIVRRRGWLAGALVALFAAGVLRDAWLMFRSPVALGIDGYCYAVQAQHFLSNHALYYPTATPGVLYLVAAGAAVFRDPVVSLKVCSLLLSVMLAAGVFGILRASTGRVWCGALGAALISLPTMHLFLLVEFVNNLGALALLAAALWCIVRASESRARIWRLGAVVALAGALFSHKMAWFVVPAVTLLCLVAGRMLAGRVAVVRYSICAGVVAVAWAAAWILALLNWPHRTPPETLSSPVFPVRLANPIGTLETVLLLVAAPLAVWLSARDHPGPPRLRQLASVTALWTLMVTLNPWLNHTLREQRIVGRFDHVAFLQVALLVPALLLLGSTQYRGRLWLAGGAAGALLAAACFAPLPYGARREFLVERERLIEGLARVSLPSNAEVIARHGEEFLITYILAVEAEQDYRPSPSAKTTYWLIRSAPSDIGQLIVDDGDSGIVLLSQAELTRLDAALAPEEREVLRGNNGHWKRYVEAANLQ